MWIPSLKKKGRCGNQHARNESYAPITHNARGSHHAKTDFPSFVLLPLIRMHVVHRSGRHGRRSGQHETTRDPAPPFGQITKELRIAGSRQNPTSPGAKLNPGGFKVTNLVGRRRGDVGGDCAKGTVPCLGLPANIRLARPASPENATPQTHRISDLPAPQWQRRNPGGLRRHDRVPEGPARVLMGGGKPIRPGSLRNEGRPRREDFLTAGGGVGGICDKKPLGEGPKRTRGTQSCSGALTVRFGSCRAIKPVSTSGISISLSSFNKRQAWGDAILAPPARNAREMGTEPTRGDT